MKQKALQRIGTSIFAACLCLLFLVSQTSARGLEGLNPLPDSSLGISQKMEAECGNSEDRVCRNKTWEDELTQTIYRHILAYLLEEEQNNPDSHMLNKFNNDFQFFLSCNNFRNVTGDSSNQVGINKLSTQNHFEAFINGMTKNVRENNKLSGGIGRPTTYTSAKEGCQTSIAAPESHVQCIDQEFDLYVSEVSSRILKYLRSRTAAYLLYDCK